MYSVSNNPITRIGLPHSDIPGSKLVYQLPEAFRRYPRPSSPVSAKASTVCPYSLDHISPSIHSEVCHRQDDKHGLPFLNCQRTIPLQYFESVVLSFFFRNSLLRTLRPTMPLTRANRFISTLYSILFNSFTHYCLLLHPSVRPAARGPLPFGGADRDRTGDPLLAKQVLSQLSYSPIWWAQVDSNH